MENCFEEINYNAIPFKLRFTSQNKIYRDIQKIGDELNEELCKINMEINDKIIISSLLGMCQHLPCSKLVLFITVITYRKSFRLCWHCFEINIKVSIFCQLST